jgi:hypothetical protein
VPQSKNRISHLVPDKAGPAWARERYEVDACFIAHSVLASSYPSSVGWREMGGEIAKSSGSGEQELGSAQEFLRGFEAAAAKFAAIAQTRRRQFQRIGNIETSVMELAGRVASLEVRESVQPFTAHITTLAPEPLTLTRVIPVTVQPGNGEFVATFFDANISASGDTDQEAVANLRDMIVQSFNVLNSMPEAKLGKQMRQQIAVLRDVVQVRG